MLPVLLGSWGHLSYQLNSIFFFLFPTLSDVMLVCVSVNQTGKPEAETDHTCLTLPPSLWLYLASVRPAPFSLLSLRPKAA